MDQVQQTLGGREAWHAAVLGVTKSQIDPVTEHQQQSSLWVFISLEGLICSFSLVNLSSIAEILLRNLQ